MPVITITTIVMIGSREPGSKDNILVPQFVMGPLFEKKKKICCGTGLSHSIDRSDQSGWNGWL